MSGCCEIILVLELAECRDQADPGCDRQQALTLRRQALTFRLHATYNVGF